MGDLIAQEPVVLLLDDHPGMHEPLQGERDVVDRLTGDPGEVAGID
jgi:hypothetical protein